MNNKLFLTMLGMILILAACKDNLPDGPAEDNGKDREKILIQYADSIIIPSYNGFKLSFDQLSSAADNFVANPTETSLQSFRNAWVNSYTVWQTVELFDFGPAETQTLRNFYNIYPADTSGIKSNMSNTSASLEVPASYSQQGFSALDYLLNGVALNDAAIVAYYKDPVNGAQRTAYIKRLTGRMSSLLDMVINDWNGAYREKFISRTGLDIGSSTSLMVNGLVMHYERFIRSGKIGIPSGAMLNGIVLPDKVEAFYKKDISRALALSAHKAYVNFFNGLSINGGTGPSIKSYLDALGAKDAGSGKMLSQLINEQFVLVDQKLNGLMPGFYDQILSNNQLMKDAFNELQAATRMLKVDMTSAMSITITYTDNDGD